MAKLILEVQTSLDGYIADTEGQTDWMVWNWGPDWTWDSELKDFHTKLTLSASHLLISRQMAEQGFIAHWQQTAELGNEQEAFARHICETPKTIISTTLSKEIKIPGGWDNAEISDDLITTVQKLKAEQNKNTIVYGGAKLVSSLLNAQLIDELNLLINPVALGNGISLFNELRQKTVYRLTNALAFSSGMALLQYSLATELKDAVRRSKNRSPLS